MQGIVGGSRRILNTAIDTLSNFSSFNFRVLSKSFHLISDFVLLLLIEFLQVCFHTMAYPPCFDPTNSVVRHDTFNPRTFPPLQLDFVENAFHDRFFSWPRFGHGCDCDLAQVHSVSDVTKNNMELFFKYFFRGGSPMRRRLPF